MLVFYALIVPALFMAGTVAADLGWYYLNVSRLQNAADAAVIAGAQELVKNLHTTNDTEGISEYVHYTFVNEVPAEFINLKSDRDTGTGDKIAKHYVSKNLPSSYNWSENNSVIDSWTDRAVTFKHNFYALPISENSDTEADTTYHAYYEVVLTEKSNHLFSIFDSFGDMNIKVNAVAKLSRILEKDYGPTLVEQMEALKEIKVYRQYYEIMNEYQIFRAKAKQQVADEIQSLIDEGMDADEAKTQVETEWINDFVSRYVGTGKTEAAARQVAEDYLSDKRR